jgi:hypothetical protein
MHLGSSFMSGDLAAHYQALSIVRNISRLFAQDEPNFVCKPQAIRVLLSFAQSIPASIIVPRVGTDRNLQVTCDSSCSGGGFIIDSCGQEIRRLPLPWLKNIEPKKMPMYEARTLGIALANIPNELLAVSDELNLVDIFTDSTATIGAVEKGYSPSADMNAETLFILRICRKRRLRLRFNYVPTDENRSDYLSRQKLNILCICPLVWEWEGMSLRFDDNSVILATPLSVWSSL